MFDGFWTGVIGGQFGPLAVHYLRRFRLVTLFLSGVSLTPLAFFLLDAYESGWKIAIHRILSEKFFGVLLVGAALGALAAFVVWSCSKLRNDIQLSDASAIDGTKKGNRPMRR